jgi:hypothetical protein
MAETTYTYSVAADFPNAKVDLSTLKAEIHASEIPVALKHLALDGDTVDVVMRGGVVQADLNAIIAAHQGVPKSPAINDKGQQIVATTFAEYDGQSQWKGHIHTAAADTDSQMDWTIPYAANLFGGSFYCDANAKLGDYIEFEIVNPGPPEVTLAKYVETMYVVPGERRVLRSGKAAAVVAGLILRATYHSTGAQPVEVLIDFEAFKL